MTSPTSETILVVDDESTMINLCKSILGMGGYNVLAAASGEDALRLLQDPGTEIHLALLDVMMRGLNGVDVARRIQSMSPGTKVVLMSGYSPADVATLIGEDSTLPIIWKPFRAESLIRMIENVLKAAPSDHAPQGRTDKARAAGAPPQQA